MRVTQSLTSAGVGLALFATFGFAAQSRVPQAPSPKVNKVQGVTEQVNPVHFSWDDLLKVQAQLPKSRFAGEQTLTPDAPDQLTDDAVVVDRDMFFPASTASGGVQKALCPGWATEPALGKKFDGQLDVIDGAGFLYFFPDPSGSVGPNHVMTMANNKTLIQDRHGGSVSTVDTSVFWSPLGATPLSPTNQQHRVNYDSIDGRWILTCKNGAAGANSIFFAISATNDPTGAWTYYSWLHGGTTDWTVTGYNQTWIAIAADLGATPKLYVVDKSTALAGGPLTMTTFGPGYPFAVTGLSTAAAMNTRFVPSRGFDTASADMYLVAGSSFTDGTNICPQVIRLTGTAAAPVLASFAGVFTPGATSSSYQLGPHGTSISNLLRVMNELGEATRNLSPFSIRTASVILRNGRLWVLQTGGNPGPIGTTPTATTCLWYELDVSLMPFPIVQGGQINGGATTASMIPSMAVNCGNDVLIGFANGDATIYPRACYAMRLGTDPISTMGPIRELKAGESSFWKSAGAPPTAAWGRWSATTVDPLDDKTFWTLQSYADTRVGAADLDSRWGTHWGRIGSCGAPTITDDPDPMTVCVGDPASFTVAATAFVAPLAYQWRKDGFDISGATAATYAIGATTAFDGGVYDCVVEDGCGNTTSLGALLDFSGATVTTQPVDQHVPHGGTASFFVTATGTGTLTYLWRRNGVVMSPAETNATLVITNVKRDDIATYDCIVSDVCGPTLSDSAFLSIPPKVKGWLQESTELQILVHPESATICEANTQVLKVVASGENLTYVWRKDGFAIVPPETNSTLTLSPITAADAGSYDCIVSDTSSSLTSDPAVMTVWDVPNITQNPTNVNAQIGDSASFTCAATGDGVLYFQWKKGGLQGPLFNIPGSVEDTHTIPSVNNSHAGRYQCAVTNFCGTSLTSIAKLTIVL